MKRRHFIFNIGSASILLASGEILKASELLAPPPAKPDLRFIVASDGHYGQPKVDYKKQFETLVSEINAFHSRKPAEFVLINGDLIHNDPKFLPEVKLSFENFNMPVHVTQGNHDRVDEATWIENLGRPFNYSFKKGKNAFICGTTTNIKGAYLSPDVAWMKTQLDKFRNQKNVFIFIHITPLKWTKYGVDASAFVELLKNYPNVRAVFNGHDHQHDEIMYKNDIPYLFDGHFGGDWGVDYNGYRVVELNHDNSIFTYLMNPAHPISETKLNDQGVHSD